MTDVEHTVDVRSVRDLVEPLVTAAPNAPEEASTTGRELADQGAVEIAISDPQRVIGRVADGDVTHDVELTATDDGLLSRCSCTIIRSPQLCPHGFATAFVVWDSD